jgi:hypothetical protein
MELLTAKRLLHDSARCHSESIMCQTIASVHAKDMQCLGPVTNLSVLVRGETIHDALYLVLSAADIDSQVVVQPPCTSCPAASHTRILHLSRKGSESLKQKRASAMQ